MKSIIFVCLGNICRSPIAEGCAKRIAKEHNLNLEISSSGTGDWHIGENPCPNSIKVCKSNGIDISKYKATQFQEHDKDKYDLVLALDESNFKSLEKIGVKNLHKLGSYGFNSQDVPDPYFFKGFEGFDKVYEMINNCVENIFKEHKLL